MWFEWFSDRSWNHHKNSTARKRHAKLRTCLVSTHIITQYCHANPGTRDCEETHGRLHGLKQSELSTPKLVKTNILVGPVVTVVNLVRANNRREALIMFNFSHVY